MTAATRKLKAELSPKYYIWLLTSLRSDSCTMQTYTKFKRYRQLEDSDEKQSASWARFCLRFSLSWESREQRNSLCTSEDTTWLAEVYWPFQSLVLSFHTDLVYVQFLHLKNKPETQFLQGIYPCKAHVSQVRAYFSLVFGLYSSIFELGILLSFLPDSSIWLFCTRYINKLRLDGELLGVGKLGDHILLMRAISESG